MRWAESSRAECSACGTRPGIVCPVDRNETALVIVIRRLLFFAVPASIWTLCFSRVSNCSCVSLMLITLPVIRCSHCAASLPDKAGVAVFWSKAAQFKLVTAITKSQPQVRSRSSMTVHRGLFQPENRELLICSDKNLAIRDPGTTFALPPPHVPTDCANNCGSELLPLSGSAQKKPESWPPPPLPATLAEVPSWISETDGSVRTLHTFTFVPPLLTM